MKKQDLGKNIGEALNKSYTKGYNKCKKDVLKLIDEKFECRFIPKAEGLNHCGTTDCIWCDNRIYFIQKIKGEK